MGQSHGAEPWGDPQRLWGWLGTRRDGAADAACTGQQGCCLTARLPLFLRLGMSVSPEVESWETRLALLCLDIP